MLECWNNGGPRSVVAVSSVGRDGARPSRCIIPSFHYSIIPGGRHSSLLLDKDIAFYGHT
jgi:hypothetical protein